MQEVLSVDVIFWNGGKFSQTSGRTIGPYKIAYWIRKHGHSAQVIDHVDKLSKEQLTNLTLKFITPETKILAISTTFLSSTVWTWSDGSAARIPEHCESVLRLVRKQYPNIKIILGGYKSEKISGWGLVDATIMNYTSASEDIFLEYLEHLKTGSPSPGFELVIPAFYGTRHRKWYNRANNPKYNIEVDDFKWSKQDGILPGEPLPLDVSRGCIFACRFCQYPHLGKKKLDYIRGMDYIEQEMLYNYENFGTTSYFILDDTFNDTEIKMQAFYDMTQRLPFKIKFVAYLRADLIHRFPNMAHLLQESGLWGAFHGIETFHPEASNIIGKAWSGKHGKEFLPKLYHDIWNKKVPMHTNFIVGITHDTKESVLGTVDWFKENNMHSIYFVGLGLYGGKENKVSPWTIESEFDKNPEKYGYTLFDDYNSANYRRWKNDNWTLDSATELAAYCNAQIKPITKLETWTVPSVLWLNEYSEDQIRLEVTHNEVMDSPIMKIKYDQLLNQYYELLMAM